MRSLGTMRQRRVENLFVVLIGVIKDENKVVLLGIRSFVDENAFNTTKLLS